MFLELICHDINKCLDINKMIIKTFILFINQFFQVDMVVKYLFYIIYLQILNYYLHIHIII